MQAWVQEDFSPVCQDDEGNELYGYFCIAPTNEQDVIDLGHFLDDHGISLVEWPEE